MKKNAQDTVSFYESQSDSSSVSGSDKSDYLGQSSYGPHQIINTYLV